MRRRHRLADREMLATDLATLRARLVTVTHWRPPGSRRGIKIALHKKAGLASAREAVGGHDRVHGTLDHG